MASRSDYKQPDVIQAFNSTSKYLDDFLNNDMVNQIYPLELQLNKANVSCTEVPYLDLHLSISKGFLFYQKFLISAMT